MDSRIHAPGYIIDDFEGIDALRYILHDFACFDAPENIPGDFEGIDAPRDIPHACIGALGYIIDGSVWLASVCSCALVSQQQPTTKSTEIDRHKLIMNATNFT